MLHWQRPFTQQDQICAQEELVAVPQRRSQVEAEQDSAPLAPLVDGTEEMRLGGKVDVRPGHPAELTAPLDALPAHGIGCMHRHLNVIGRNHWMVHAVNELHRVTLSGSDPRRGHAVINSKTLFVACVYNLKACMGKAVREG